MTPTQIIEVKNAKKHEDDEIKNVFFRCKQFVLK